SALHPLFLCSHQPSWQQSHQHSWQQSHQLPCSNLISIPGSNLISFLAVISSASLSCSSGYGRDAFTPGCDQILSSQGPLFTMLQNMASLSPSCSLQLCVQKKTPLLH
ncbi:unnamed protein product, partial [Staurois parvus]